MTFLWHHLDFLPANFSARVRASVVLELDGTSSEFSVAGGFNMFSIENGDASMLTFKQMDCLQLKLYFPYKLEKSVDNYMLYLGLSLSRCCISNLTEGVIFVDRLSDLCVVPVPLEKTIFIKGILLCYFILFYGN